MATVKFADNAYGTLGGALASTASALSFTSGHGARFPAVSAGECLYVCLLNSNNVLEEIQITTHVAGADTADIVRAVGATTAKAWNAGDRIEARLSSTAINNKFSDQVTLSTFTGTFTGVNATVTGPIKATLRDDVVTLQIPQFTGTSTSNAKTVTGMPAALRPTTTKTIAVLPCSDNGGAFVMGYILLSSGGVMTYGPTANTAVWTTSGVATVSDISCSYKLT